MLWDNSTKNIRLMYYTNNIKIYQDPYNKRDQVKRVDYHCSMYPRIHTIDSGQDRPLPDTHPVNIHTNPRMPGGGAGMSPTESLTTLRNCLTPSQ